MKNLIIIALLLTYYPFMALAAQLPSLPVKGTDWEVPDVKMEFIWIKTLNCWAGKYEVTNDEYRKFKHAHDSTKYDGNSLNGGRQPVVYVNYNDAIEYAKWLTERERKSGRLPVGYIYRLPTQNEWITFCQCGDNREYPWGKSMPPKYGNYSDRDLAWNSNDNYGYSDGFHVTCPVEMSGKNDWGLYGVGGNVWECTVKSEFDLSFDSWRGASWDCSSPGWLQSSRQLNLSASVRDCSIGFRLVLSHGMAN